MQLLQTLEVDNFLTFQKGENYVTAEPVGEACFLSFHRQKRSICWSGLAGRTLEVAVGVFRHMQIIPHTFLAVRLTGEAKCESKHLPVGCNGHKMI